MNIPAPSSSYGTLNLRENFAGSATSADPWGSYGMSAMGSYGDNYLQQAYQYQAIAFQQLQNGALSPQEKQQWSMYLQQLNQWIGQYEMYNGGGAANVMGGEQPWDPMATGGAPQGGPLPSYQDLNQRIFENDVGAVTAEKGDVREEHYYAPPYDFTVPGSATAKVSQEPDPNHPTEDRILVTVTWPDGTEKKHYFYNVDWKETAGLTIHATAPEHQITLGAKLSENDHVRIAEIGSDPGETLQAGDPPTRMEGERRIFDGQSFSISPVTEGADKQTTVLASGEVTITPNSNEEYFRVDFQNGKYVLKVYATEEDKANNKVKETITIDGALIDWIHFAGDPSRIEFSQILADPQDPHGLNTSKEANKIALENGDEESLNMLDTPPDSKEGATAIYEKSSDVDVHANFDDSTTIHEIWASNSVLIHGASNRDKLLLEYDEGSDTLTVKIYKNGDTHSTPETFIVHNAKETNIALDVPGESSLLAESQSAAKELVQIGLDGKSASEKAEEANKAQEEAAAEAKKAEEQKYAKEKEFVKNFLNVTGVGEAEFLNALKASGYSYKNIEEVYQAIKDKKFPPSKPDTKLLKFLAAVDDKFNGLFTSVLLNQKDPAPRRQGAQRLVELLGALYREHHVRLKYPDNAPFHLLDDFEIDGAHYQWFSEKSESYDANKLELIRFN